MMVQTETTTFSNTGETFSALYAAEAWLRENGYSYGSMCGPGNPIGFIHGDHAIAKWRNLSKSDIAELDGQIECRNGSYRDGSVVILFKPVANCS